MNTSTGTVLKMQRREVDDWNQGDIIEWICTELNKHNRDFEDVPLDSFKALTIEELRQMSQQEFYRIIPNPVDAEIIYKSKEELFRNKTSNTTTVQLQKTVWDWNAQDIVFWICSEYREIGRDYEILSFEKFSNITVARLRSMTQVDFCNILEIPGEEALFLYNKKEALFRTQLEPHGASKYLVNFTLSFSPLAYNDFIIGLLRLHFPFTLHFL